jgi:hypothetical protein
MEERKKSEDEKQKESSMFKEYHELQEEMKVSNQHKGISTNLL